MGKELEAARTFVSQVYRMTSWSGDMAPPTSLPMAGAEAMAELLLGHPVIAEDRRGDEVLRLFGPTDDVHLEALRSQSLGFMLAGAIALGMTGRPIRELAKPLVIAATDLAQDSLDLRAQLFGNYPFQPPVPAFPAWKDKLDQFVARNCFVGVERAIRELGAWASNQPSSDAEGITGLSTSSPCGGSALQILGGPFGNAQPADVRVFVPILGGGCREATVDKWEDERIEIRLPRDVGPGCVGFVRGKASYRRPQRVTGELTVCIGAVAEVWTRGFSRLNSDLVSCPPCLLGGQNRITTAGPPQILSFECTPHIEPGGQPILSWDVRNATQLRIVTRGGPNPGASFPSPIPPTGSYALSAVGGTSPVNGWYELVANNLCGEASATTTFLMSRTPRLSIDRIEVVQAIQRADNSVRLVAAHRTIVRVFVNSGISDGFDFGYGSGLVEVETTVVAENLDTGTVTLCPEWRGGTGWSAAPTHNRNSLPNSKNHEVPLPACSGRVRFKAVARTVPYLSAPRARSSEVTVDAAFVDVAVQQVLPFLIQDPSGNAPTPTIADFLQSLEAMSFIAPIPMSKFLVNPPLAVTLQPSESLRSLLNWVLLTLRLSTTVFLFPSSPVSGLRIGIVPDDGAFPNGGTALPRVGLTTPAFIAKSRKPRLWAHELGHAYGLYHVRNTDPADPTPNPPIYDPILPLTISEPGLDIGEKDILPAGTNELMSYAKSKWISVEHWDIVLDKIPV